MRSFKGKRGTKCPGTIIAIFVYMKKAKFVPLEEKKDLQVQEDIRMTPEQRFRRMFELIELSLTFSPTRKLKVFTDDRFIEVKRRA